MAALQAGGVELVVDGHRPPDQNNPNGYFEHQSVLDLATDAEFLEGKGGLAVKVIYRLLQYIPIHMQQKVIFLERDLDEVIASQNTMLKREADTAMALDESEALKALFEKELLRCRHWLEKQKQIQTCWVKHRQLLEQAHPTMTTISNFLKIPLDIASMTAAVDPKLYRHQARRSTSG